MSQDIMQIDSIPRDMTTKLKLSWALALSTFTLKNNKLEVILLFRSVAVVHVMVILKSSSSQTSAHNSNAMLYLNSINCKLFSINVAV